MPSRRKVKAKAKSLSPADVASIAKDNPYIQRLIEDADLRDNVRKAAHSTRSSTRRRSPVVVARAGRNGRAAVRSPHAAGERGRRGAVVR